MKITVKVLIKEVKISGRKVAVPVLTKDGVWHLIVQKSDLLAELNEMEPEDYAPWSIVASSYDLITLDVA